MRLRNTPRMRGNVYYSMGVLMITAPGDARYFLRAGSRATASRARRHAVECHTESSPVILYPDTAWYLFKKLLKEAGLPDVRFHDLRHNVATILLAAKIDLKVVSELLGHSPVAITPDIYAQMHSPVNSLGLLLPWSFHNHLTPMRYNITNTL